MEVKHKALQEVTGGVFPPDFAENKFDYTQLPFLMASVKMSGQLLEVYKKPIPKVKAKERSRTIGLGENMMIETLAFWLLIGGINRQPKHYDCTSTNKSTYSNRRSNFPKSVFDVPALATALILIGIGNIEWVSASALLLWGTYKVFKIRLIQVESIFWYRSKTLIPAVGSSRPKFGFPFQSKRALQEFDQRLVTDGNYKTEHVKYFSSIGGSDRTVTVNEALKKLNDI
ncbi:unnamed protein product [Allacma fusca]|uniref:Uncharacterized protein n=1 Tax=Allacma fusca TaxID=39272 RepID=A0A8J2J9J8_9HEXA|nr:unnamed protein product [Allacma fusca]